MIRSAQSAYFELMGKRGREENEFKVVKIKSQS
jgi:hypothetical protein